MKTRVIGLFFQNDRRECAEIAGGIMNAAYPGVDVRFAIGELLDERDDDFSRMEFAVSIGGDGTFLRTARAVRELRIPLFGINAGHLGFLASGSPESAADDMRRLLAGRYALSRHIPLKGEISRDGENFCKLYALNEIAVYKGVLSRPIDLDVSASGVSLYRFLADGIIVSTPTGSTAYALSAGGPVVNPGVRCIVAVPVCPHSLYPRPVILGEDDVVEIRLAGNCDEMLLSCDGQHNMKIRRGDVVRISLDTESLVNVVKLDESSFYDVLRSKFGWGGSEGSGCPESGAKECRGR